MNQTFTGQPDNGANTVQGQMSRGAAETDDTIDLGALFQTLWRGKFIIFIFAVLAVLAGGYYAYVSATPLYRSTAVVMLETQQEKVVDLQSVVGGLSGDSSVVNSEVEVLKSRSLLEKVVNRLDLTRDPEFNSSLQTPSFSTVAKAKIKDLIGLAPPPEPELPPDEAEKRTMSKTVDALLSKLTVRNVPLSLVFQVTIETESAEKSARIADALVDLYILNQLEVKFDATQQATEWLTDRVTELKQELETAEAKVKNFSAGTDLINQDTLAALERQLKELRDRVATMRTTIEANQAQLAKLEAAETPQEKADASGDTQLQRLLPRIDEPSIAEAFDTRFDQVLQRARMDVERGQSQLTALINSQKDLEGQIDQQSKDLITLQQLTREADASRMLYEYFLSRLKETSAQQGIQQADSRVLSHAVVPSVPSEPRKSLILAMSGMLGLMLGVGVVLLREARHNTFRTARDLERGTGYTVMGQIPLLPARRRRDAIAYLADKPTSAAAEAIRNLRTSVLLSNVDHPPQVIVTTSSIPGEGKTTLSLALAQNFTGMGKKVLLIEGDIRRRVFSQYLDTKQKDGLLAVLSGEKQLSEVVLHDDRVKADILIGEKSSTNAADLFASESFNHVLAEARKHYDQIIIDTPPVLVVPDARVIAQQADAILFIVRWDMTSKPQVEEALHMFESVNQGVTGIALNQISPKGMKRYGYGGKYGAYSSYGRKYYVN